MYVRSRNRERTRANQPRRTKIEAISWKRPVDEGRSLYFLRAVSLLVNRTVSDGEKRVYPGDLLVPELKLATRGVLKQGFSKRRKRIEQGDINQFKQAVEGSLNGARTREVAMTMADFKPELQRRHGRHIVSMVVRKEAPAYEVLAGANNEVRDKWWEITDSKSGMKGLTPRIDIAQVASEATAEQAVNMLSEDEIVVSVQRKTGKPNEILPPHDISVVLRPAEDYPIRLKSA